MNISIKKTQKKEDTLVVFVPKEASSKYPKNLNPYKNQIQPLLQGKVFSAQAKSCFFLPLPKGEPYKYLLIAGIGSEKTFNYEGVRQVSAKVYKELQAHKQEKADILIDSLKTQANNNYEQLCQAATEGFLLTSYTCEELRKEKSKKTEIKELFFSVSGKKASLSEKGLKTGRILGEAVNFARRLGNYPGNLMTPSILASEVVKKTKNTKIKTTVWDKKRIQKERMGGLLGVSLGSSEEPRFIIMEYKGAAPSKKPVALVGKGLTFDSGGISLKPAPNMHEMKFDMCGATAVIGALLAIEKLKLKVNVTGYVPSSENMPGQSANKPGDILKARNGKTMEVLNTDAEGRLILADALSYASEQKPQAIFDAATLTGAIIMALSNVFTGFFTKNENLVQRVHKASQISGERCWRLPLTKEHTSDIKSSIADVANISSGKGAGSSTAAAFLEHFVDKKIPWVHFDIAGTAWNVHNRLEYCSAHMASGVMVRTFVELARSFQ